MNVRVMPYLAGHGACLPLFPENPSFHHRRQLLAQSLRPQGIHTLGRYLSLLLCCGYSRVRCPRHRYPKTMRTEKANPPPPPPDAHSRRYPQVYLQTVNVPGHGSTMDCDSEFDIRGMLFQCIQSGSNNTVTPPFFDLVDTQ